MTTRLQHELGIPSDLEREALLEVLMTAKPESWRARCTGCGVAFRTDDEIPGYGHCVRSGSPPTFYRVEKTAIWGSNWLLAVLLVQRERLVQALGALLGASPSGVPYKVEPGYGVSSTDESELRK